MNFDFLGLGLEKTQLVVAGALGGLVRWLTLRDHWLDGLISVVVGAICSLYLGPLALPALTPLLGNVGMPGESVTGLSGFLVGIGGITASGFFIDLWRARRRMLKQQRSEPPFTGGEAPGEDQ
jgi:hypothetical protein